MDIYRPPTPTDRAYMAAQLELTAEYIEDPSLREFMEQAYTEAPDGVFYQAAMRAVDTRHLRPALTFGELPSQEDALLACGNYAFLFRLAQHEARHLLTVHDATGCHCHRNTGAESCEIQVHRQHLKGAANELLLATLLAGARADGAESTLIASHPDEDFYRSKRYDFVMYTAVGDNLTPTYLQLTSDPSEIKLQRYNQDRTVVVHLGNLLSPGTQDTSNERDLVHYLAQQDLTPEHLAGFSRYADDLTNYVRRQQRQSAIRLIGRSSAQNYPTAA